MVRVLVFYSKDPNSNPAKVHMIFCECCFSRFKLNKKRSGLAHLFNFLENRSPSFLKWKIVIEFALKSFLLASNFYWQSVVVGKIVKSVKRRRRTNERTGSFVDSRRPRMSFQVNQILAEKCFTCFKVSQWKELKRAFKSTFHIRDCKTKFGNFVTGRRIYVTRCTFAIKMGQSLVIFRLSPWNLL